MRSGWTLLIVLGAAGCLDGGAGPGSQPAEGSAAPPAVGDAPGLALLSSLALTDCKGAEYLVLLDEAPPASLPAGMQPVLQDGRLQVRGLSAECLLAGQRAAFTIGAVLVNVTGPLQGPGQHGLVVRVAVDSPAMLEAMAAWGLRVPQQRAWSIQLVDEGPRRFLHLDDLEDAPTAPGPGTLLHATRFDLVEVDGQAAAARDPSSFRWFEASSNDAAGVVTMLIDEERGEYGGAEGPARIAGAGEVAPGEGLQGTGIVGDGLAYMLHGRRPPPA